MLLRDTAFIDFVIADSADRCGVHDPKVLSIVVEYIPIFESSLGQGLALQIYVLAEYGAAEQGPARLGRELSFDKRVVCSYYANAFSNRGPHIVGLSRLILE